MITQEQYNNEKRKEAEFNKLFDTFAQNSPFGQWYGYMIKASNMLTKNLPKCIAIDKDGRPVIIYKGQLSKIAGVWGTATHKSVASDFSQGKWLEGIGGIFGAGHIKDMIDQNKKYKQVFDISPDEITQIWKKRLAASSPQTAKAIKEAEVKDEAEAAIKPTVKPNTVKPSTAHTTNKNKPKPKKVRPNAFITLLQRLFGTYKP